MDQPILTTTDDEGADSSSEVVGDFDPAAADPIAFSTACKNAAAKWKRKLRISRTAASAKHAIYFTLALLVVVFAFAMAIAMSIGERGSSGRIFGAVIGGLFRWAKRAAYGGYWEMRREAKGAILSQVLPPLNLGYSLKTGGFPSVAYKSAGLMPGSAALEDHISGRHSGVDFDLCESTAGHTKGEGDEGKDIWQGILLAFTYRKKFKGRTLVVRDGGAVGNFFKAFGKDGERITLEDPRFEDRFEVFGTDQIEARYLLTPAFMERLVELDDKYRRGKLKAAFVDNKLLLVIDDRDDRFELHLVDAHPRATPGKLLSDLEIPCQIVDALKLDAKTVI